MNRLTRNKILHPLQYRRHRYATRPRDFTDTWTDRDDYDQSLADHISLTEEST